MVTVLSSAQLRNNLTGMGFPRLITWGLEAAPAEITSSRTTEIIPGDSIEASVAPSPAGCKLRKYPVHSGRPYASNWWARQVQDSLSYVCLLTTVIQ